MNNAGFWQGLDALVASSTVVIDRPKGSVHPRYPDFIYPLDYGFLEGTRSGDGDGIDIWVGTLTTLSVTAVICTVYLHKRDLEMKLLLGCTHEEIQMLLHIHNDGSQAALLFQRPEEA